MLSVEATTKEQELGDEFHQQVMREVRIALHQTNAQLDPRDPLHDAGMVRTFWTARVDGLIDKLNNVVDQTAADVRNQLQTAANAAITAALGPDDFVPPADGAFVIPNIPDLLGEIYLATRRNYLVGLGDEIWQIIREVLGVGMGEGEGIAELRERVIREVPEMTMARAERIARTEVVGAANAGSFGQMKAAGLRATKTWLATGDGRTRPDHAAANGQTVDLNEKFNVGGHLMDRPHDPNAPASEIVNCRCTLTYEIADDDLQPLIASAISKSEPLADRVTLSPSNGGCTMPEGEAEDQMETLNANEGDAAVVDAEELGGKPNPGTKKDKRLHENDDSKKGKKSESETEEFAEELAKKTDGECPPGMEPGPDGKCVKSKDAAATAAEASTAPWEGVLAVEGITTGDGREFAPDALTWGDLPIPLRWNKEDSHGGEPHTVAVNVGRIDEVWRDGEKIMGKGVMNLGSADGREAHSLVKGEFLRGVSIDADSITDADVEYVFADAEEGSDEEPDFFDMLFMMPEKIIFHSGRIRAATLCDIPAFVEAYIQLTDEQLTDATVAALAASNQSLLFGAMEPHSTDLSDAPWEMAPNAVKLAALKDIDPQKVKFASSKAREAFAWINVDAEHDGQFGWDDCKFLHHEIDENGKVGPANLTACAAIIGQLNTGRGSSKLSASDRRGVYEHMARHLRDADREPAPANFEAATLRASAVDDRPKPEWFQDPKLSLPTGITVTDDGRVYGHAAMWGECHVGIADVCVNPPHEDSHPYFMTGEVVCQDGTRAAVGQITLGTGHADLMWGASKAAEHYDNTGTAVADVAIGNDAHGIWVAGQVRPGTDARRVRELQASGQVSGDWRRIGGQLRLVGLLAVNVPGFPVPKVGARVASGAPLALVAAGRPTIVRRETPQLSEEVIEKMYLRLQADKLAKRIGLVRKGREG